MRRGGGREKMGGRWREREDEARWREREDEGRWRERAL